MLGIALSWFLLDGGEGGAGSRLSSVRDLLAGMMPGHAVTAALFFVASVALRAVRLSLLSHRNEAGPLVLFPVTAAHVGLGHILPARISDIALIALLRGYAGLRAGSGLGAVVLAKLMDLLAVGLVVLLAVAGGSGTAVLIPAAVVLLGALAGLVHLRRFLAWIRGPLARMLDRRPAMHRFYDDLTEAAGIWQDSPARTLGAAACSIAIWVTKLMMFVQIVAALRIPDLPLWKVFFAGAVTELIMALPIQGLFNFGVAEAGWTAGMAAVGVSGEGVVISGFGIHLMWMFMAVSLLVLCLPFFAFGSQARRNG